MKLKSMFLAVLLASATVFAGCAEKAETIPENTAETSVGYTLSDLRESYEAGGGVFSFSVDKESGLKEYNSSEDGNYEFAFQNEDDGAMISVMSIVNFHQTIESVCKGREKDYAKIYTHILGSKTQIGGNPAYQITGSFKDGDTDFKFGSTGVQYGNGDLFFVIYTVPSANTEKYEKYANDIFSTIQYTGEPLKTDEETYETNYFSLKAGPEWCFYNKGEDQTTIIYNLAENDDSAMCTLKITSFPISENGSAEQQVNEVTQTYEGNENVSNFIKAEGKVGEYDAHYVGYNLSTGEGDAKTVLYYDVYFFDKDDRCYTITMLAPESVASKFMSGAMKVINTLTIK